MKTLFEAVLLVTLVVIVFLQKWRAAIIPVLAIPVSLIGTAIVLAALRSTRPFCISMAQRYEYSIRIHSPPEEIRP